MTAEPDKPAATGQRDVSSIQLDRQRQIPWACLMRSAFTAFPVTRKYFLGTGSHLCGLQKKAVFSGSPLRLHKHMCMGTPTPTGLHTLHDTLLCSQDAISLTPQRTTPNIHGHGGDGGADRAMLDASWKLSSEPVSKDPRRQIAFLC